METNESFTVEKYVKKNWKPEVCNVSIVIPAYNRADDLFKIITQTANYSNVEELLIIDDCSYNQSELQHAISKHILNLEKHSNIKLICRTVKTNAASCRNLGISLAIGKYIFLLDSDDSLSEEFIERRVNLMTRGSLAFFGAFEVLKSDGKSLMLPRAEYKGGDPEKYLFSSGDFRTSTVSFDSALKKLVLFDEKSEKHQDWILFLSSSRKGLRWQFDPHPGVKINASRSDRMSASLNAKATIYFACHYLYYFVSIRRMAYRLIKAGMKSGQTFEGLRIAVIIIINRLFKANSVIAFSGDKL